MKLNRVKVLMVALAVAGLALAGPAQAVYVSYTVVGSGPMQFPGPVTPPGGSPHGPDGYPGDTVELETYAGGLELAVGTSVHQINTLQWNIDFTYAGTETQWDYPAHWSLLSFAVNVPRGMSWASGAAGTLSQAGLLDCEWENDFLAFSGGLTTSFVVQGYRVDVTPLALARMGGGDMGAQTPRDMEARFDVSEVPEPTTMILGGLLLTLVGACRLRSIRGKRAE